MNTIPPVNLNPTYFSNSSDDPKTILNNVLYTMGYWAAYGYSHQFQVDPNALNSTIDHLKQALQQVNLNTFNNEAQNVIKDTLKILNDMPQFNLENKVMALGDMVNEWQFNEGSFGDNYFQSSKEALGIFAVSGLYFLFGKDDFEGVDQLFDIAFASFDPTQFPSLVKDLKNIRSEYERSFDTQPQWLTTLKSYLDQILPQMKNNLPY